jgi:hypothetical protein
MAAPVAITSNEVIAGSGIGSAITVISSTLAGLRE